MTNLEGVEDRIVAQFTSQQIALAKKKLKWIQNKDILLPVVNALAKIDIEADMSDEDLNVRFTGDKQKLIAVMRIVRQAGFDCGNTRRPQKGESSWTARFQSSDSTIDIWLSFSSSVCKQVQTGTRTIEVPVYETQCGDISNEEDKVIGHDADGAGDTPQISEIPF